MTEPYSIEEVECGIATLYSALRYLRTLRCTPETAGANFEARVTLTYLAGRARVDAHRNWPFWKGVS